MKNFTIWLVIILALVAGAYFAVNKYFPQLLPSFIPVSKDVKQFFPLSTQTLSPFIVPKNYNMDIFVDLKNDLPRDMVFDSTGSLIVSLTSRGKVVAIVDTNNDYKADEVVTLLSGLNRPHGLVVDGRYLYVAESDKVARYAYDSNNLILGSEEVLFDLPDGGRHFTRTIRIHNDKLYTSIGSSCDACVETSGVRASILWSNLDGSDLKIFAKGLRNTVFFDFDNQGNMWGADMGRDGLGDNLPPEEVNLIEEGKDYGWPYCYGNRVKDTRFNNDNSITCESSEPPKYELPAHTAPLGFVFDDNNNAYIALHGSWNSTEKVGYKVIQLSTYANSVTGYKDVVTGFIQGKDNILGRPAGLVIDNEGNLYISDDKSGLIYILSK